MNILPEMTVQVSSDRICHDDVGRCSFK